MNKLKGEKYKLLWKQSPDFVRLASKLNCTIVPFAAVGGEQLYPESPIILLSPMMPSGLHMMMLYMPAPKAALDRVEKICCECPNAAARAGVAEPKHLSFEPTTSLSVQAMMLLIWHWTLRRS